MQISKKNVYLFQFCMKLVIPMSGQGHRFVQAGYQTPKPLIQVEGKPIIEHVLNMFPGEEDVIFICNEEHLATTPMQEILTSLKPNSRIISIPRHEKGPAHAVAYAFDDIKDDEEVMVSYCDFTQSWDYEKFKQEVKDMGVAGAIPSYTGFHPHLLHKNLYGGILCDNNNIVIDYKEKHCFTDNPEDSHHSTGAYYFSTGELLKKYTTEVIHHDINVGGEHYMSLLYYLLLRDNLPIYVPEVSHFMQWGTPEDLEEYEAWSRYIHTKLNIPKALTYIPKSREYLVKIPYSGNSPEFVRCYNYWYEYIKITYKI